MELYWALQKLSDNDDAFLIGRFHFIGDVYSKTMEMFVPTEIILYSQLQSTFCYPVNLLTSGAPYWTQPISIFKMHSNEAIHLCPFVFIHKLCDCNYHRMAWMQCNPGSILSFQLHNPHLGASCVCKRLCWVINWVFFCNTQKYYITFSESSAHTDDLWSPSSKWALSTSQHPISLPENFLPSINHSTTFWSDLLLGSWHAWSFTSPEIFVLTQPKLIS